MNEFLLDVKPFILLLHIFGLTLGLGGAIVTDFMFLRFLKDYKVSVDEKEVLDGLSLVIWGGMALLIATGVGLFLPYQSVFLQTPAFIAKMVAVGVILVNGFFLNFYISPRLTSIVFNNPGLNTPEANTVRKYAPIFGGISIVSWTFSFFLGSMRNYIDYPLSTLLGAYVALLLIGITTTMVVTKYKFRPRN